MTADKQAREERGGAAASSGSGAGAGKAREKRRDEAREASRDTAGSITSVANAAAVESPAHAVDVAPLEQLIAIRQEQARLDQFRERADSMKTKVDDAVFQRVVEDYTRRHRVLEERAEPLKAQARGEYRTLQAWRAGVDSTHEDARLIKQELQFRHAVGELDEGALAAQVREPEETLARCAAELASIDALHARFAEAFGSASALDAEMRAAAEAEAGGAVDAEARERAGAATAAAASAEAGEASADGAHAPHVVSRDDAGADARAEHGAAASDAAHASDAASHRDAGDAGIAAANDAAGDADRGSTSAGAAGGAWTMVDGVESISGRIDLADIASSGSSASSGASSADASGADGARRSASGFWNRPATAADAAGDRARATDDARPSETVAMWADGEADAGSASPMNPGDVLGLASARQTLPPERANIFRTAGATALDETGEDLDAGRGASAGASTSAESAALAAAVLLELIDIDPAEAAAAGLSIDDVNAPGAVRIGAPHTLGSSTTIGRADEAQLRIVNPSVSRQHAVITILPDGGYALRDLHSQNGTFVNGERIDQCALRDGDEVVFGDAPFLFRAGPSGAHPAL